MKLAKCPYCGRRLPYFTAFMKKSEGEFLCKRCLRESNIVIRKQIFTLFGLALALSVIILILYLIFGTVTNIIGIILVALPLIGFFALSPTFIALVPLKKYANQAMVNQRKTQRQSQPQPPQEEGYTRKTAQEIKTFKKPIDEDIFKAIKEERKRLEKSIEETTHISGFDQISSTTQGFNKNDDDVKVYRKDK